VVHAAEVPLGSIIGARLYEHKKVLSLTGHFKPFVGMVLGRKYWQTLPKEVQQLLRLRIVLVRTTKVALSN
jgi:TRAP-type C4-dicarboxylate transport system substrate-binding protein